MTYYDNPIIKEFMEEIKDIRFVGVDDFFKRRENIRDKYKTLNNDIKEVYKWYFYHQLCLLRQKHFELKDLMWLYLNGEKVDVELTHQYYLFCKKRSKINYNSKID